MELSKNYRIVKDENNVILQFHEYRTREKGKLKGELYEFTDDYYYPNLKTALKSYVNKTLSLCRDIEEVLLKISELEDKLIN